MKERDTGYRCTVCGREGTVGRCCGDETRIPINELAKIEQSKRSGMKQFLLELAALMEKHEVDIHPTEDGMLYFVSTTYGYTEEIGISDSERIKQLAEEME